MALSLNLKEIHFNCQITAYRWFQASNASETIVLPRDSICVNSSVDYNFRTVSGEEGRSEYFNVTIFVHYILVTLHSYCVL